MFGPIKLALPASINRIVRGCPTKIMAEIQKFGASVKVIKPIESMMDPVITLSYYPAPPALSIRTIMTSIAAASCPPFKITVHHPPTIEELNRQTKLREGRRLLYRLIFAIVAAIPTLILGVVYPLLVKDGNPITAYLLEPMWAGNVSRVEWALFIIATPVMFYSCSTFHQKSIQRVYALWRPGAASYFDRFARFGSMDLLVSLGVSVAYFSSIGVLALSASRRPQVTGENMNYFDTVVFLTVFLLAGEQHNVSPCKST